MTAASVESTPPFKDYCLILQIHPEADGGMVEAAYWHLAKRYSEEAGRGDQLAIARLDDLNEAYSVMGSPERREEYFQVRNAILGIGTLPSNPTATPEAPLLAVLEKQHLVERETSSAPLPARKFDLKLQRFIEPTWQNMLVVVIALTLGSTALAVSFNLVVVFVVLVVAMLISAVPLALRARTAPPSDRIR